MYENNRGNNKRINKISRLKHKFQNKQYEYILKNIYIIVNK